MPNDNVDSLTIRSTLVGDAIAKWVGQLYDLTGRNNLLYFKELKVGTLSLRKPGVREDAVSRLIAGTAVRLSELYPDAPDREDAARRARNIYARAKANDEEKGVHTLHIGYGMATWSSDRSMTTPCSPILLRPLELVPIGVARGDFILRVVDDWEVNEALLHILNVDFGVDVDVGEYVR